MSDSVSIRTFTRWVDEGQKEFAEIEAWPEGPAVKPVLDFLHVGDVFEDEDGREWKITKAVQSRHRNRYFEEEGRPEFTYTWRYDAMEQQD